MLQSYINEFINGIHFKIRTKVLKYLSISPQCYLTYNMHGSGKAICTIFVHKHCKQNSNKSGNHHVTIYGIIQYVKLKVSEGRILYIGKVVQ